ncbi:MAG: hypothetical protein ABIS20_01590 [Thermoanaerobaculia bacterium]
MTNVLLWLAVAGTALIAVLVLRIKAQLGAVWRKLDGLSGDQARTLARIESFERQLNEYWRGVEMRVGRIHETFESGRACRMGTTIVDVDVKMGHLNRKMDELLNQRTRPEQGERREEIP